MGVALVLLEVLPSGALAATSATGPRPTQPVWVPSAC